MTEPLGIGIAERILLERGLMSAPTEINSTGIRLRKRSAHFSVQDAEQDARRLKHDGYKVKITRLDWGPTSPTFWILYRNDTPGPTKKRVNPNDAMFLGRIADASNRIFRD